MTGRIELWERKYRARVRTVTDRLDALAGPVLSAYESAVASALGDTEEVLLVRDVSVRLAVNPGAQDEADLARLWGQAMAAAVLRAAAEADVGNVVRFPDRAAHLAAFLLAAADGRPTDDWLFARFAAHRRAATADTLAAALLAHPELAAHAVRRLHQSGALGRVVAALGPAAGRVWAEAVAGTPAPSPAAERPLFAAALAFAGRLGAPVPSRDEAKGWFADFLAGPRPPTDWRDRMHLAEAVAAALRFILARAPLLTRPTTATIAAAVVPLDWLDAEWLARRVAVMAGLSQSAEPVPAPARPGPNPSPRQRQWLESLRTCLPRLSVGLDPGDLRSAANALLAFAAVTADRPEWANDPALPAFIELFLSAAAAASRPAVEANADPAYRATRQMGPPAVELVHALAARTRTAAVAGPLVPLGDEGVATAAAGAFLLLRAANDLRLTSLARRAEYPVGGTDGPRWLLAALAARWAGLPLGPTPDPGVLLLAGIDPPFDADAFRSAWAGCDSAAFQLALARVLLGHWLLSEPGRLAVAVVMSAGGDVAFAGDESTQVWPFAAPVESAEATEAAVVRWRSGWQDLTGTTLEVVRADSPSLAAAVEALAEGKVGDGATDATLAAAAQVTVRAWARWLGRLGGSSTPYLLGQFIRRPGRVRRDGDALVVELAPRPLDPVLQAYGYLEPVEPLPSSGQRAVRFELGGPG